MTPKPNEIEVTVFGPGYGECIVIHIGSGKWAIIDSCLDDAFEPASLSYLRSLGRFGGNRRHIGQCKPLA